MGHKDSGDVILGFHYNKFRIQAYKSVVQNCHCLHCICICISHTHNLTPFLLLLIFISKSYVLCNNFHTYQFEQNLELINNWFINLLIDKVYIDIIHLGASKTLISLIFQVSNLPVPSLIKLGFFLHNPSIEMCRIFFPV